jgi:superfamily II DNA helicase RecQ
LQELVEGDDEQESVEALQMGHTRKTDNKVYGVSQEALRGAPEDILPLFLEASTDWQIICRVVPGGLNLCYSDALMSSFQAHIQSGVICLDIDRSETPDEIGGRLLGLKEMLARMDADIRSIQEHCVRAEKRMEVLISKADLLMDHHSMERRPEESYPAEASDTSKEASALCTIRKLLGKPEAQWKSEGQRTVLMSVLDLQHDVIAILPTNAGKSMVAIIPPLLEDGSVTVLILPLRILVMDFQRKLQAMDVSFYTYDSNESHIHLGSSNLVLVSADHVQWDAWKQAIVTLHQRRPVVQQIIDEAHIPLLSEDFRQSLQHMSDIRCSIPLQLVLLTASGHHELLAAMRTAYTIEENAIVVHEPSNCPELRYVWQTVQNTDLMLQAISSAITTNVQQDQDRGIIFVPWKELGETIASHFGLPFYYGGNSDNASIYKSWLAGDPRTVVATSAFGTGNDCSHVRLVVHACAPYEMVFYVQEVSRAGRDGSPALCLLLRLSGPNTRTLRTKADGTIDLSGKLVIFEAVQKLGERCIRSRITSYNDGRGVQCLSDDGNQVCERCRAVQKAV